MLNLHNYVTAILHAASPKPRTKPEGQVSIAIYFTYKEMEKG